MRYARATARRWLMNARMPSRSAGAALLGFLVALVSPASLAAQEPSSADRPPRVIVRTVPRPGTLIRVSAAEFTPLQVREPVLTGDTIHTIAGARAELTMADRNLLRLGRGTEIALLPSHDSLRTAERLAVLELRRGTVQLVLADDLPLDLRPTVETINAHAELDGPGSYVLRTDGAANTVLIVRDGRAHLWTGGGGVIVVHSGDEVVVEGLTGERALRTRAREPLALELWGRLLTPDGRLSGAVAPYAPVSYETISGQYYWLRQLVRVVVAVVDFVRGTPDEHEVDAEEARPPEVAQAEVEEESPAAGNPVSEPGAGPPSVDPAPPGKELDQTDRAPRPRPKPWEVEPLDGPREPEPVKDLPEEAVEGGAAGGAAEGGATGGVTEGEAAGGVTEGGAAEGAAESGAAGGAAESGAAGGAAEEQADRA